MRGFAERFRGAALEVALEATAGRRFVVEELRAAEARVHLAEPAETAASREWLSQLELPATAREQITIAQSMIDAHALQLAPLDLELRE